MTYSEERTENTAQVSTPAEPAYRGEVAPVIGFGEWFGTILIMMIPVLNFIMLIVWISERYTNPNKVNWAKATLVMVGIQLVVTMFIIGTFIGSITNMMSEFGNGGLW